MTLMCLYIAALAAMRFLTSALWTLLSDLLPVVSWLCQPAHLGKSICECGHCMFVQALWYCCNVDPLAGIDAQSAMLDYLVEVCPIDETMRSVILNQLLLFQHWAMARYVIRQHYQPISLLAGSSPSSLDWPFVKLNMLHSMVAGSRKPPADVLEEVLAFLVEEFTHQGARHLFKSLLSTAMHEGLVPLVYCMQVCECLPPKGLPLFRLWTQYLKQ